MIYNHLAARPFNFEISVNNRVLMKQNHGDCLAKLKCLHLLNCWLAFKETKPKGQYVIDAVILKTFVVKGKAKNQFFVI